MIKEGIYINGIYQHFKGYYYKVIEIAQDVDGIMPPVVLYHKCDINGVFQSIRSTSRTSKEIIVFQPFYRFVNNFLDTINIEREDNITKQDTRFKFIKQL